MKTSLTRLISVRFDLHLDEENSIKDSCTCTWHYLDNEDRPAHAQYVMNRERDWPFDMHMRSLGSTLEWRAQSMERQGLSFQWSARERGWTIWINFLPSFRWPIGDQ